MTEVGQMTDNQAIIRRVRGMFTNQDNPTLLDMVVISDEIDALNSGRGVIGPTDLIALFDKYEKDPHLAFFLDYITMLCFLLYRARERASLRQAARGV